MKASALPPVPDEEDSVLVKSYMLHVVLLDVLERDIRTLKTLASSCRRCISAVCRAFSKKRCDGWRRSARRCGPAAFGYTRKPGTKKEWKPSICAGDTSGAFLCCGLTSKRKRLASYAFIWGSAPSRDNGRIILRQYGFGAELANRLLDRRGEKICSGERKKAPATAGAFKLNRGARPI
ncbi:hypothetical protein CM49_01069 [Paenibacillus sp. P1XP2]|nr:hypothetical protein CM49_01069 [Paenibacillus sp. P1XP2]